MDSFDRLFWLSLAAWGVIAVIVGISLGVDELFINPIRADDALRQCQERGFDQPTSFSGFFRYQAYGVLCEDVNVERKNIDVRIDNDNAVGVVV